ncbi:FAD-binding oxidoreductase [Rhizobium sp. BK251]|uniref:FAD-binding oxidoreductase n=1 Tax=Rhizobium sp. BK251 TaxID=2512125 RepID=UPI0010D432D2|nr:FAD-binding oxidoreductase [Rhizobium sp. BK251]TCL74846.1 FAD/FMN-containing dehydrogenase [Rhizobium sp. BK251]
MSDLIERTLSRLDEKLVGHVSLPGSDDYAAATAIWARPIGRIPQAIAHCVTAEDVSAAILAARECYLPISVRGGGHDWAGRALCEGIVIDMRDMKQVVLHADKRSMRIAGGALAKDVVGVTDLFGLAAVTGSVGVVGMAGLTLGGGYGPLIGRFGLALDNMLAAEVVLSDGRVVVASQDSEEELFWSLRGGGGNFGVVTAMRHRLHELPSVRSGMVAYPFAEARAVLEHCAEIAATAPDALTVQVGVAAGPDGQPFVLVVPTWCGVEAEGEARVAPFLKLGTLLFGELRSQPYGASLKLFDAHLVNGRRTFMETCWMPELNGGGIEAIIRAAETMVSPGCALLTHEFRGAASRVAVEATAFALREDHVLVEIIASCAPADDVEEQKHRNWARTARMGFDAVALSGGYPNLLADGDALRATESYGRNANRLVAAKRRYDPDNVFASAIPLPLDRQRHAPLQLVRM